MSEIDEDTGLRFQSRDMQEVTVHVPAAAMEKLREVASWKDMDFEALLKLYIGKGLREDTARLYSQRLMETTARVLAKHIESEDERSEILREIRGVRAA
jgi:hypothetical protein